MNTAWFFGDSFTAGYGAEENSEYSYKFGPGKTFDNLLAEYYNCRCVNFGVPGCSNITILSSILSELANFSSGDKVIIGNTSPLRDIIPNKEGSRLIDQKLFDTSPYKDSLAYGNDKLETILRSYCLEFRADYIHLWSNYYNKMFIDILRYLESINISGILWDYSAWSEEEEKGMMFENIHQATNGEVYDLHWSFKGHQDAYEWINNGLKTGKKFIKKLVP
jgi:hypothetical protein